jgi:hypothetical protein
MRLQDFGAQFIRPVTGMIIGNPPMGAALTTQAGVANRQALAPFILPEDITVDQVYVNVSTANASNVRVLLHEVLPETNYVGDLIYESTDIDTSTTGDKVLTLPTPITFKGLTPYYGGVWHSGTSTLRGYASGGAPGMGWTSASTPARLAVLNRSVTFGTNTPWPAFTSGQAASLNPVLLRFRVA